jgi:hypothetical protein
MAEHPFNSYPEDRREKRKRVRVEGNIWVMRVPNPYSYNPGSIMAEIIRRPVRRKKIVGKGLFGKRLKTVTVWERIPDDPEIPVDQVEEWARQAVEYINANLDVDYTHETRMLRVERANPAICFETSMIPEH